MNSFLISSFKDWTSGRPLDSFTVVSILVQIWRIFCKRRRDSVALSFKFCLSCVTLIVVVSSAKVRLPKIGLLYWLIFAFWRCSWKSWAYWDIFVDFNWSILRLTRMLSRNCYCFSIVSSETSLRPDLAGSRLWALKASTRLHSIETMIAVPFSFF